MSASSEMSKIEHVPGPWTLKGTIYTFATYTSTKDAASFQDNKDFFYAPLELNSGFAEGEMVGGLGMVQVIRYSESPVGPYDELLVVPGFFKREEIVDENANENEVGKKEKVMKSNVRVTRIYVSQERTCWNGRKNWNIPKHLADFKFVTLPNGAVTISVCPRTTNEAGIESVRTTAPFFTASFKPIPYLPSFPLSTGPVKYLGLDLSIVQPPLPVGKGELGELAGTEGEGWCKINPYEWSRRCRLGWWDLRQAKGETEPLLGGGEAAGVIDGHENWWPGLGRWQIGVIMEDAVIEFEAGQRWL